MKKSETAGTHFNVRVAEDRIACQVCMQKLELISLKIFIYKTKISLQKPQNPKSLMKTLHNLKIQVFPFHHFIFCLNLVSVLLESLISSE